MSRRKPSPPRQPRSSRSGWGKPFPATRPGRGGTARPGDRRRGRPRGARPRDAEPAREAVRLELERCEVRSFGPADAASLARHADNREVWRQLRDAFPHPYTERDARTFIEATLRADPQTHFAIAVGGEAVGAIGLRLHSDVERVSAEIGYWLGEAFWGRGIVSEALPAVTRYAMERHGLTRIFAVPFDGNTASHRVLEKAGYRLEGRMRHSAIKDGRVVDQLLYAFTIPSPGARAGGTTESEGS